MSSAEAQSSLQAEAIIQKLHAVQYPSVYPYVEWVLILCSIFYFLVILLCITILAVPFIRGPKSRAKHCWLWRRHYMGHPVAYFVPNGGIAVAISQIFGCTLFEVYILLTYQALLSPDFARHHYQYSWLTISYSPGYFGFWYSAFGALYICLFSPSRPNPHRLSKVPFLPNPIFMNTICIGTPIFTALGSIGLAIISFVKTRQKNEAYDKVISQLSRGLDPTQHVTRYVEAGHQFIVQFRWASFCWSIAAALAVLFYCFTILLFLRLLKATVDVANGKKSLLGKAQVNNDTSVASGEEKSAVPPRARAISAISGVSGVSLRQIVTNSQIAERLRNGYRFLVLYCGLLAIVLTIYFVVGLLLTVNIGKTVQSEAWRSLFAWLVVSSSLYMTGALLVQSWRILKDPDDTQEDQSIPATRSERF